MTEEKSGGICPHCREFVEAESKRLDARDILNHLTEDCEDFNQILTFDAAKKVDGEVHQI